MLRLFRGKKFWVKALLWAIVLPVGFMMVITLVPGIGGGIGGRDPYAVVARVGKQQVTSEEVLRRLSQLQAVQGLTNPFFRRLFAQQLIDDMIFQRALEQEASRLSLQVTPEEVSAEIRAMPIFYPNGQFVGAQQYQMILQRQFRMSVAEFEEEIRRGALINKMYLFLTDGLTISEAEIREEFRRRNEKVTLEFVVFKPPELENQIRVGDEELRAYFNECRSRYQLPERRQVRYVAVDFEWVEQQAPVTQAELEAYYQRNLASYRVKEQVRFSHILFRFPPGSIAEQKEEVRKKARQVQAQLQRGQSFAALAKKYSEDPGSAEAGGDVGWVERGQVVPALEAALFSLKKGEVSDGIEVSYGIHLVRVTDRQQARLKSFEEVRDEIEPIVARQKNQEEGLKLAQRVVEQVRAGKPLEQVALEFGLRVLESPWFSLTERLAEFGESSAFQEAAFRLRPDEVSEPVAVPPGYAVLQLLNISPPHTAEFEEVREKVERAYRQEHAGELARERARAVAEKAQKSGNLQAAARSMGAEVEKTPAVAREGAVPNVGPIRDIAPVVFGLAVGGVSPALPVAGNWVVLRVVGRAEADWNQFQQERNLIARQLLQQKQQLTFQIFRESLKKKLAKEGELEINPRAVERLVGAS